MFLEPTIVAYDEAEDVAEFNESLGEQAEDSSIPSQRGGSTPKNKLDAADYHSWACYGNDQFTASSKTVQEIPPGVYRVAQNVNGHIFFMKQKLVTDNLFRLADSVSLKVLESIEKFYNSKERFKLFGMIYKRGIMLFGPPGSGKTVTVTLLAQQIIERGGIVIMCENPSVTSQALQTVRRIEPQRPVVNIIEDIDTMIENWGEQNILPMLDGENQVDNIVHVATTNYPERLDGRFVNRPSRFDEIRKVDMPKPEIRREYMKSVMDGKTEMSEDKLAQWVADTEGMSLAHLRELVVAVCCLERSYDSTIARLKAMQKRKPKSSGSGGNGAGFETKRSGSSSKPCSDYDEVDY